MREGDELFVVVRAALSDEQPVSTNPEATTPPANAAPRLNNVRRPNLLVLFCMRSPSVCFSQNISFSATCWLRAGSVPLIWPAAGVPIVALGLLKFE